MYRNRCGEAEILNLCAFTCGSCPAPPQTLEWSRATAPPMAETTVELATTVAATTFSTMARTTLTKSFPEEIIYQPPKCEDKEKFEFCNFWKSQVSVIRFYRNKDKHVSKMIKTSFILDG